MPRSAMLLLKSVMRRAEQAYLMRRGVRRFRGEFKHGVISLEAITEIWLGWGNTSYSASPDVLYELVMLAKGVREQTVLECGGGVSTLLLALVSEKTGTKTITIEHDTAWCVTLRDAVSRHSRGVFEVRHAPLVHFDGYEWYRLTELEDLGSVGLVFCDGPPGQTPGGRIGILKHLAAVLPRSAIIVIDDSNRPPERAIAARWASEYGLSRRSFLAHRGRGFDILSGTHQAVPDSDNGLDRLEQPLHLT